MFTNSADGAGLLGGVVVYILLVAISVYVGYLLIRTAILRALNSHYKTVRLYEKPGEWAPRYQGMTTPRDLDGSQ